MNILKDKLNIVYVPFSDLIPSSYNPRTWTKDDIAQLKESITRFGIVDPLLVNNAPGRENILIGGHFRLEVIKELGITEVPVVYINIPDLEKEKELNIRLNKNTGEFDLTLLAEFDESLLKDVGFDSEALDEVFGEDDVPEEFNIAAELEKLDISEITVKDGDVYDLDGSRLMCGDSTKKEDTQMLMGDDKADLCLTDPPYRLQYLKGKTREKDGATEGFGMKKNRRYIGTDELPLDFTEKWMANIAEIQKPHFSIICYENWKNIREIWNEMEKHWKVKNMIVWHLPNRNQGFAGKYKFFSKYDIAVAGASRDADVEYNLEDEEDGLQEEYETALFAIAGKPHWESYGKGKKYCPTDFIDFNAADEKSSGQGIIFGIKPIEILIPYIKVLTKRGDLVVEPFGGSGSTLIASTKLHRRCFIMEKCPTYAEVILNRWEKLTGKKRVKIYERPER